MVMYGITMVICGLLKSWAAPACNNPVFAEIVPAHLRTLVYSFDRWTFLAFNEIPIPSCLTYFAKSVSQHTSICKSFTKEAYRLFAKERISFPSLLPPPSSLKGHACITPFIIPLKFDQHIPSSHPMPTALRRDCWRRAPASLPSPLLPLCRCFEGAIAACAAPLVGLLAQEIFGFKGAATRTGDRALDLAKANAIGNALLCFMIIPWTLCLIAYCGTPLLILQLYLLLCWTSNLSRTF